MELIISLALGVWISIGGWLAYRSLKKEYQDTDAPANNGGGKK